jgi:hypothetical protein
VQQILAAAAGAAATKPTHTSATLLRVVSKFQQCSDPKQRYQLVLSYADSLPAYPEDLKQPENRVLGCSAQVGVRCQEHALFCTCWLCLHAWVDVVVCLHVWVDVVAPAHKHSTS